MKLPVDDVRPQFTKLYQNADAPLIVTAPTGSGKSTRLPLWMGDLSKKVLVIEPRRVACRALATFLSKQANLKVGDEIGYSVRFENMQSHKTKILFATPGVALRILSEKELAFDAVLIDEFHERGWEVDLVTAVIRSRRARGEALKFVVTSATLDAQGLKEALSAELIEAQGRTYPVDIMYQRDASLPSNEDLEQRVERAVRRALDEPGDGEVLVFLPGKGEIASCASQLGNLQRQHPDNIEVLEVHASLPMNRLMRAFEDPTPGKRRVFLSTNVAETSLTLPGVTWVVDSGLVRMQVHRAGKTALSLLPTSQASMDQRAGRAGRVRAGHCIRLWDASYRAQEITAPEIERVELDDMVLRAGICGLEIMKLEQMPWVTAPPEFAVEKARARLIEIGAVSQKGEITNLGEKLLHLPVSTDTARLLVNAPTHLLGAVCDLVALMERGYRLMLRLDRIKGDQQEHIIEARKDLLSDVDDEVLEALTVLRFGEPRRHHLHEVGLRETQRIAENLRALTGCEVKSPKQDTSPLPDRDELAAHLLSQAPEMGFVLRERAQKKARKGGRKSTTQPWANGDVEVAVSPYKPFNIQENPHYKPPTTGIICDHTWLGDRKGYGARGRGSLLLPCSARVLAKYANVEVEVGQLEVRKRKGSVRIEAVITRELAGVSLTGSKEELEGTQLQEAAASLVLENRIFKGAGEALKDRLHILEILSQWVDTLDTQHWNLDKLHALESLVVPPEQWLTQRFEELGLQTCDEIELLENEDLLPDLIKLTGLYQPEIDLLFEDFPRIWEHQGAQYVCQVFPRQRKVEMSPENKAAKQSKEPATQVLPRFQGYRVRYKQASRVIMLRG